MAEMMGTFLNLMGAVRTLVLAVAIVAVTISALSVFNTMLTSVLERTGELGVMRAVGASRGHVFGLLTLEALLLTVCGSVAGLLAALIGGRSIEDVREALRATCPRRAAPDADGRCHGATVSLLRHRSGPGGGPVSRLASQPPASRAGVSAPIRRV